MAGVTLPCFPLPVSPGYSRRPGRELAPAGCDSVSPSFRRTCPSPSCLYRRAFAPSCPLLFVFFPSCPLACRRASSPSSHLSHWCFAFPSCPQRAGGPNSLLLCGSVCAPSYRSLAFALSFPLYLSPHFLLEPLPGLLLLHLHLPFVWPHVWMKASNPLHRWCVDAP